MAEKYGDVFSFKLGNRLVVVLNGSSAIEEALVRHSTAFAGRPQLHTFKLANQHGNSLIAADYSPHWRLTRKISVGALHSFTKSTDVLEDKLMQECQRLVECLKQQQGKPVNVITTLQKATANTILNALYGVSSSYEDEDLQRTLFLAASYREAMHGSSHVDFIPLLRFLPNALLKKLANTINAVTEINAKMFMDNKATYTNGEVRNVADSFLGVIEKESLKMKANQTAGEDAVNMGPLFSDEQIIEAISDIFGAGFDTSSITLHWALAYLVKYPDIQHQLQEELDQVIGRQRLPSLSDLKSLPFLQATVYELLRVVSIAPLSVPRSTTTTTKLRQFTIPKDTIVFVNLWSVHRDPSTWKDPDVFNPRRFLNGEGEVIDPKFCRGFLPFSAGRRKCPGESLALSQVSAFLGALLHSFRFTQDGLPAEYQGLNLQGRCGLTLAPEPFYVRIEKR